MKRFLVVLVLLLAGVWLCEGNWEVKRGSVWQVGGHQQAEKVDVSSLPTIKTVPSPTSKSKLRIPKKMGSALASAVSSGSGTPVASPVIKTKGGTATHTKLTTPPLSYTSVAPGRASRIPAPSPNLSKHSKHSHKHSQEL